MTRNGRLCAPAPLGRSNAPDFRNELQDERSERHLFLFAKRSRHDTPQPARAGLQKRWQEPYPVGRVLSLSALQPLRLLFTGSRQYR